MGQCQKRLHNPSKPFCRLEKETKERLMRHSNKMASLCDGWKLRWTKGRAVTWIIDNRNRCWATHLKSASSVSFQLYGHLAKVWLVDMANIFPEGDIIDLLSCVNQSKFGKFDHFSLDFMVLYVYNHISLDSSVMLDANAAFLRNYNSICVNSINFLYQISLSTWELN